jgi:O-antigen/teichoic acid export membrane protein
VLKLNTQTSFYNKLISGILTASISTILLLLYPFIISKIGLYEFGLWASLNIIFGAGYLIDFGVIHSSIRLISKKNNDLNRIQAIIFHGLMAIMLNIATVCGILFFLKDNIVSLINIADFPNYLNLFYDSIILLGIICLQNFLRQLITGIGSAIKSNFFFSLSEILRIALLVIYINDLNVEKLIFFQTLSYVMLIIIYVFILLQKKLLKPFKISKNILSEIFSFSKYMSGIKIFNLIFIPTVKIIISNLFGIIYLGIFELSFRIVNFGVGIFVHIIFFLFPQISAESNNPSFIKNYLRSVKKMAVIAFLFCIISCLLIVVFKDPIAIFITNNSNDIFIASLIGGIIYLFIEIIDQPLRILLLATNRPYLVLKMLIIQALVTFILFIFFNNEFLYLIMALIVGLIVSKITYLKSLPQT